MIRVEIKPQLLSWACERAGYDLDALEHRFQKLTAWGSYEPAAVAADLKRVGANV